MTAEPTREDLVAAISMLVEASGARDAKTLVESILRIIDPHLSHTLRSPSGLIDDVPDWLHGGETA